VAGAADQPFLLPASSASPAKPRIHSSEIPWLVSSVAHEERHEWSTVSRRDTAK